MSRYDRLPPGMQPRGLTREAAAAFVGLAKTSFDAARARGEYPDPTLPGGRYDRVVLEAAMNRLSGLVDEDDITKPLDAWRAKRAYSP